jgi:SWI/SNF-related matrix-associated actin-dependent regulator 1 of chromatin subfamily A
MPTQQLRTYQSEGVERLMAITAQRSSALLADEPGLGKTIQVVEYINRMGFNRILIVCPASLRLNWRSELDKWLAFTPQHIEILSYEGVVSGYTEVSHYDLIVFDEAHYLKNPSAKRTKACLALESDYRLFLTGTPVVNRPMEMYPARTAAASVSAGIMSSGVGLPTHSSQIIPSS